MSEGVAESEKEGVRDRKRERERPRLSGFPWTSGPLPDPKDVKHEKKAER